MAHDDRVVWSEGMFMRAQHFQQDARYVERLVRARTRALRPYGWGLSELKLNRELLSIGRFAVERAAGVFEDGTPFSVPDDAHALAPMAIPENTRDAVVYLSIPLVQPGMREVADADSEALTRYATAEIETPDANSGDIETVTITIAKMRMRYSLVSGDASGMVSIGLARIAEVRSDNSILLDEGYVPPVLDIAAAPILPGLLTEIVGLLNHRGEAIASRISSFNSGTAAELADTLMLQTINRWQPIFAHLASASCIHPEDVYRNAVALAGELSTFTSPTRRPRALAPYDHRRLQASFAPLAAALRDALNAVLEQSALAIPLTEHRYGIRVAEVADRSIFGKYTFVVAVKADMPSEMLQRRVIGQTKVGPAEQIRELVNAALPGIMLRALPVAPRQVPYHTGKAYFELDRASPLWKQVAAGNGLVIHMAGEFPALEIDLWAVKD